MIIYDDKCDSHKSIEQLVLLLAALVIPRIVNTNNPQVLFSPIKGAGYRDGSGSERGDLISRIRERSRDVDSLCL